MAKKAPNPIDVYAGSRVRMRREQLGMSQEKLGNALGITFQQVQKNEKGINRMGASRLVLIAHHLHVDVSYFFKGMPEIKGLNLGKMIVGDADPNEMFCVSDEGKRIIASMSVIKDPLHRDIAASTVEAIAAKSVKRAGTNVVPIGDRVRSRGRRAVG